MNVDSILNKMLCEERKYWELKSEYGAVTKQHAHLHSTVRKTHKFIINTQAYIRTKEQEARVGRMCDDDDTMTEEARKTLQRVGEQMFVDVKAYMQVEKRLLDLHRAVNQSRRRVVSLARQKSNFGGCRASPING